MRSENGSDAARPAVKQPAVLVHLSSGIGNIVLATPLLQALHETYSSVDLMLDADYEQVSDLFADWCVVNSLVPGGASPSLLRRYDAVVPAIPPFYWPRFRHLYRSARNVVARPPDDLFYRNEQDYYLSFARLLGWSGDQAPCMMLPLSPSSPEGVTADTVVLAPGCKTGEMAAKRWPHFPDLGRRFGDVAVVGIDDDLKTADGKTLRFPSHCRSYVGKLTLKETARLMAAAAIVVGNDSGLSHLAAALGAPTIMLFGPTPDSSLGRLPSNATIVRARLSCEPCWFANRFAASFICSMGRVILRDTTKVTPAAQMATPTTPQTIFV